MIPIRDICIFFFFNIYVIIHLKFFLTLEEMHALRNLDARVFILVSIRSDVKEGVVLGGREQAIKLVQL